MQCNAGHTSFWGMQVAELFLRGIEDGRYIPRSPDASADFLVNSCLTPCGPRPYVLAIDMLLAPLYVLMHWLIKQKVDSVVQRILVQQTRVSTSSKSHLTGGRTIRVVLSVGVIAIITGAVLYFPLPAYDK